jgi:hypothetical protein
MRPAPFEYLEPETVADACTALRRYAGQAAVLAGGQSLLAQLNARERRPAVLVSLRGIPQLTSVEVRDGVLRVGAAVTQRALQRCAPTNRLPVLQAALEHVGHVHTRNWGTLGGSIAFADPAAELPVVLLGLGGSVRAHSTTGQRPSQRVSCSTARSAPRCGPTNCLPRSSCLCPGTVSAGRSSSDTSAGTPRSPQSPAPGATRCGWRWLGWRTPRCWCPRQLACAAKQISPTWTPRWPRWSPRTRTGTARCPTAAGSR